MRSVLPLLLAASVLPGCSCGSKTGADQPTPVTLVFTNTSAEPVFIDATDATFGLVITPQGSAVTEQAYFEAFPGSCACLSCDVICGTSGCPGATCSAQVTANPLLELLPPGGHVQRTWSGVYLQSSMQACGGALGGQACLQTTNDFPNDTFTARVCYALSVNAGQMADAGVPFSGTLPSGDLVCATKDFHPAQGTVQLAPPPPAPCGDDAGSCPSGQLCFGGLCSAGCPVNGFPSYGGGYFVDVGAPSGPFFLHAGSGPNAVSSGIGTLTSVTYGSGSTNLTLSNDAGLAGDVTFNLPQLGTSCCLEAFHPGETLSVTVVETPPVNGASNRGLVIRDGNGQLIQVADMAANGPILGPAETAPFTVTLSATPLGCSFAVVGCKAVYSATLFSTPEGAALLSAPGQLLDVATSGATFGVLNVTNTSYQVTSTNASACAGYSALAPYAILNTRP